MKKQIRFLFVKKGNKYFTLDKTLVSLVLSFKDLEKKRGKNGDSF